MNIRVIKNLNTSASRAQFSLLNTPSLEFFPKGLSSISSSKLMSGKLHLILRKNGRRLVETHFMCEGELNNKALAIGVQLICNLLILET
jgi:hypothetical protein